MAIGIWLAVCVEPGMASVTVYGGPTYNAATHTGYIATGPEYDARVISRSVGIGSAGRFVNSTLAIDERAFRIDTDGFNELAHLPVGTLFSRASDVNESGTIVGWSSSFSSPALSQRPVRWDANGTLATELETLRFPSGIFAPASAVAINTAGTIVGVTTIAAPGRSGYHAARWDAGGTAITELEALGEHSSGAYAVAQAINDAGPIVGFASRFQDDVAGGTRAARWDANSIVPVELDGIGTDNDGVGQSEARDINEHGEVAGFAKKYINGVGRGNRAIRWDAGGTAPTELETLGFRSDGYGYALADRINASGTRIGFSERIVDGVAKGSRAVRWDAGSVVATELGNLGTDANGETSSDATDINDEGITVGYARVQTTSTLVRHALMWLPGSTTPIDLNSMIDPSSGWVLSFAHGISNTNWITGKGKFDPDGVGPIAAYDRQFLLQVPEPALPIVDIGLLTLRRRRQRDNGALRPSTHRDARRKRRAALVGPGR
ncbi:hypothetical protein BH09PLA1_BH09PLA1_24460 [soil metagenome]